MLLGGLLAAMAGRSARADAPGYAIQEAEVVYGERVYVFAMWYTKSAKVPGADAATFRILDRLTYGRDARHAYYQGKPIPGADAASFALVAARGKNQAAYAKDQSRVYFEGFPLPGADPATFTADPKHAGLARDRRQVYLGRRVIPGADPATFERLAGDAPIGRDRRGYYFGADPVTVRDAATFEILDANAGPGKVWARDAHAFYVGAKTTATEGIGGPQILAAGYTKDSSRVYYKGDAIPGADAASFNVRVYKDDAIRGDTYVVARDRRHFYIGGMATADIADGSTFEELGAGYARDSRQVYFLSRVVEGADPATFRTKDVGRVPGANRSAPVARDKFRAYQAGNPLPSR